MLVRLPRALFIAEPLLISKYSFSPIDLNYSNFTHTFFSLAHISEWRIFIHTHSFHFITMSHCYYYRVAYQLSFIGITFSPVCVSAVLRYVFCLNLFGFYFVTWCMFISHACGGCHPRFSHFFFAHKDIQSR